MAESGLRPKGSVEVTCSFPGCGVTWWVSPLDPNLHGPHNCGQNHAQQNILDRQLAQIRLRYGFRWGTIQSKANDPNPCICNLSSARVGFYRRDGSDSGVLSWDAFSEVAESTADELAGRIEWGVPAIGLPAAGPAPDGLVGLVYYKDLTTDRIRRYIVTACSRCHGAIYVDYDRPGHRTSWSVGGYNDGLLPAFAPRPEWMDAFTCEMVLGHSVFTPQPCAFAHSEAVAAFDALMPWTIWTYNPAFGVAMTFFDRPNGVYGLFLGPPNPSPAEPISERIFWGGPRELLTHYCAQWPGVPYDDILDTLRQITRESN